MDIKQIATFMNDAYTEMTGAGDLVLEDLSNIADAGKTVFNANQADTYLGALVNRIGRYIFVDRPYAGKAPKILMDAWEYGSVLAKADIDMPAASDNEMLTLVDGTTYSQDQYHQPRPRSKFYNTRVTLEVICPSITEEAFKQSFVSPEEMNRFVSMIYTACENRMTLVIDDLIYRTINSQIVATINDEYGSALLSSKSGVRAVNLLYLYNSTFSQSLTKANALYDLDFLRFAGMTMRNYTKYLQEMVSIYNNEGRDRFTPAEELHVVLHTDFASATTTYLQAPTFHQEMVALPRYEEVTKWQGTGLTANQREEIKAKLGSNGDEVKDLSILGVMFDHRGLAVGNLNRFTPSHYNSREHFWNLWYQLVAGPYRDDGENFVVFFMA